MRCPARSDQNRQATQHGLCVAVPNPVTGEIPACRSGSGIDFEFFGVAIRFFPPADACMALCALPYRPGRIAALILGHRLAAPQQLRIRSQRRETNSAAVAAPFARSPPAPHSAETEIEITLPSPTREYQMKNLKIASTLIAALMLTAVVGCASTAKQESTRVLSGPTQCDDCTLWSRAPSPTTSLFYLLAKLAAERPLCFRC